MQIPVSVETCFTDGFVVSFTDEYGVEYRGALLKLTDKSPEYKGPSQELANPLSFHHDHSYEQTERMACKQVPKKVPNKVLHGWNSTPLPLTPQRNVCKRNGYVRHWDKQRTVLVELDKVATDAGVNWRYYHKAERTAKFIARNKMKDTCRIEGDVPETPVRKKRKKPTTAQTHKRPLVTKPAKTLSGASIHSAQPHKSVIATVVPSGHSLSSLVMSPSLKKVLQNAHTQPCTVGISPTSIFGITPFTFPHNQHFSSLSASPQESSASRDVSVSPANKVKPFSISLQKIPPSQVARHFAPREV